MMKLSTYIEAWRPFNGCVKALYSGICTVTVFYSTLSSLCLIGLMRSNTLICVLCYMCVSVARDRGPDPDLKLLCAGASAAVIVVSTRGQEWERMSLCLCWASSTSSSWTVDRTSCSLCRRPTPERTQRTSAQTNNIRTLGRFTSQGHLPLNLLCFSENKLRPTTGHIGSELHHCKKVTFYYYIQKKIHYYEH